MGGVNARQTLASLMITIIGSCHDPVLSERQARCVYCSHWRRESIQQRPGPNISVGGCHHDPCSDKGLASPSVSDNNPKYCNLLQSSEKIASQFLCLWEQFGFVLGVNDDFIFHFFVRPVHNNFECPKLRLFLTLHNCCWKRRRQFLELPCHGRCETCVSLWIVIGRLRVVCAIDATLDVKRQLRARGQFASRNEVPKGSGRSQEVVGKHFPLDSAI
mmetsp:Transcript_2163/g.4968  ORF Transcript_2163/g.4968 Transcript_2163/m.4968 type:complete len:217 (-) Transcript_2163:113-763(-)